jgi:anti-anti-sigma factor
VTSSSPAKAFARAAVVSACRAVYVGDRSALLAVSGEFDMAVAPRVRELLGRLAAEGITDHIAFDLTECTFIDSTGLDVLVAAQKAAKSPLNVAADDEQIRKVLGVTGLADLFRLCSTHEEALEALQRQFGKL